jgi:hypothetical protein
MYLCDCSLTTTTSFTCSHRVIFSSDCLSVAITTSRTTETNTHTHTASQTWCAWPKTALGRSHTTTLFHPLTITHCHTSHKTEWPRHGAHKAWRYRSVLRTLPCDACCRRHHPLQAMQAPPNRCCALCQNRALDLCWNVHICACVWAANAYGDTRMMLNQLTWSMAAM